MNKIASMLLLAVLITYTPCCLWQEKENRSYEASKSYLFDLNDKCKYYIYDSYKEFCSIVGFKIHNFPH